MITHRWQEIHAWVTQYLAEIKRCELNPNARFNYSNLVGGRDGQVLGTWPKSGGWDLERMPIFMALNSILNAARMPIFEAKMPLKRRNAEKNSDIQIRVNFM